MSDSQIFKTAVKLPPEERQAYLDKACGDNPALRQEVESLLRASDVDDSFLEKPAADPNVLSPTVDLRPITETAGSRIGPYQLLQQIGEGGMGVVYLAEQLEPVRRKVALKIIKPGMDSRQVVARFEAERQALAMMEHQNIARVLDAGTTETGRPYFVMELVKGVPITEYCDKNQLTPRQRLELFVPVCHAVQHAHQKGIIHRDLKPSNVLVCLYDGQPTPKVIDFGVAKATQQRLTEKTMFTQHGQIVGTLEYMSPEQAEMSQLDIDTRSDIYSLGVLLYELLTGSTPITKEQLCEVGFAEMLQLICAQEPDKPSTRLSESGDALPGISAQRKTEPKKLSLLLRGELDWIVMKALEKDRTRRYETANGFARDIQRHLDDEPVEACPPSARYRLRKFARKHRVTLATTAAFAALLIVGVVISTWQAVRATHAQREAKDNLVTATVAQQEAQEAEARAKQDRDRALIAEQQAQASAVNAVASSEKVQDTLARSLFQQARAVRLTDQPGRRWQALGLLQRDEQLRGRERLVPTTPEIEPSGPASEGLPERTQLRSEAVASLLLQDGKVTEAWDGYLNGVSPGGRFLATFSFPSPSSPERGARVIDLQSGKDVCKLTTKQTGFATGWGVAVAPDGKRLAAITVDKVGAVIRIV
ncbi:MAG: protein kinase, partial [Pirellulales bacterium]